MDKKLKSALSDLEKDDVQLEIQESTTGDHLIIIKTKNYKIVLGVSDLGVWLEKSRKKSKNRRI